MKSLRIQGNKDKSMDLWLHCENLFFSGGIKTWRAFIELAMLDNLGQKLNKWINTNMNLEYSRIKMCDCAHKKDHTKMYQDTFKCFPNTKANTTWFWATPSVESGLNPMLKGTTISWWGTPRNLGFFRNFLAYFPDTHYVFQSSMFP